MKKHFLSSPKNRKDGIWWSDFLSSFSHIELYHLAGNLAALTVFGPASVTYLGNVRFFVFIILSAILGSFFERILSDSPFAPDRIKNAKSLGFSGINSALFIVYFHRNPQAMLSMSNRIVSVKDALFSAIAGDFLGFVLDTFQVVESPIAHLVHLAGYASGFFLICAIKFQVRMFRYFSHQQPWKLMFSGICIGYLLSSLINDIFDQTNCIDSLRRFVSQYLQF